MTFMTLWYRSKGFGLGEGQAWLRDEIRTSLTRLGIPTPRVGDVTAGRLVLGVAEYSERDVSLLDRAVEVAAQAGLRLEVFMLTGCASQHEIEAYVPNIGNVYHSPVVGIWRSDGTRVAASGAEAWTLLRTEVGYAP